VTSVVGCAYDDRIPTLIGLTSGDSVEVAEEEFAPRELSSCGGRTSTCPVFNGNNRLEHLAVNPDGVAASQMSRAGVSAVAMRGKSLLAVTLLAALIAGCETTATKGSGSSASGGSGDAGSDGDLPPTMTLAEGRKLKLGTTRERVFAQFGKSDFAEGPSPATAKVGAERCFTYRVPGTERQGTADDYAEGETVFDSWWICFDAGKLVHKDRPDGDVTTLG
jgi:hypothetical protein